MSVGSRQEELLRRAAETERRLADKGYTAVADATRLLTDLREDREYDALARIAELILRLVPSDHKTRRLYGHALIEIGKPVAALDVLKRLRRRLPNGHPEEIEANGLIGRAWKEIFLAAPDRKGTEAVAALQRAFRAYKRPYQRDPQNSAWHAVNLLALSAKAERLGVRIKGDIDRRAVASGVLASLASVDEARRDAWHWATVAEASIALGDWDGVVAAVRAYAAEDGTQFQLASTVRQFSRLWGMDEEPEGAAILAAVKARLLDQPNGLIETNVATVRREADYAQAQQKENIKTRAAGRASAATPTERSPDQARFEAVLGQAGVDTFRWWHAGLRSARSVASVRRKLGERRGTSWLATAAMFGLGANEQVVVTNFHVVNAQGAGAR